jgi:hypothetical protein
MDIKNTHKQELGRIEKPRETIMQRYIKRGAIAGVLLLLFLIIGPIRNYIKSKQPKFTGLIFLFNPEGEKIEDQMLEKYGESMQLLFLSVQIRKWYCNTFC